MYIALMGSETDPQIQHVANAIAQKGHYPIIVNTQYFGGQWQLCYDPDYHDGYLHFPNEFNIPRNRLALSSIDAAYWHQYLPRQHSQGNDDPSFNAWREQEYASTLMAFFKFDTIKWVNSVDAIRSHQCKPAQLRMACKLGAKIPFSYIGNGTEMAYQFCDNIRDVIYKPVKGGKCAQFFDTNYNLRDRVNALLLKHPVTFQAFIAGTNVRSYVINNEVISVQIESDELDFRDDKNALPVATVISKHDQQLAIQICKGLGMVWCAIDWRRDENGALYFLEANPCPYYLFVENETGTDITGKLLALFGIN